MEALNSKFASSVKPEKGVYGIAKAYVPEKADLITASINDFAAENGLPFRF